MAVLAIGVCGLDDGKSKPYFIRRAHDDPIVFAGLEPATTGSKDYVGLSSRCLPVR
jgi:putative SOS response-associated peptidase YedK